MSTESEAPSPIKFTWLLGVLVAFAIFALIAGYSGHMTRAYPSYSVDRANERYATLKKLQAEENALLTPVDDKGQPTAEWVDQAKGIVRIPIDEAMAREVDTLKNAPAHMSPTLIPVAPPAATPAPAAPAASTNAAPVAPAKPTK